MAALLLGGSRSSLKKEFFGCPSAKRHSPIGADDQGRVIATIVQSLTAHAGQTYPLFGPVEMDHEQMAAELTLALGRKIVFQNVSIADYCKSLEVMGLPAYVVQGPAIEAPAHERVGNG
jgi:uncharacterized protein YbjT (DUF2867 family)